MDIIYNKKIQPNLKIKLLIHTRQPALYYKSKDH